MPSGTLRRSMERERSGSGYGAVSNPQGWATYEFIRYGNYIVIQESSRSLTTLVVLATKQKVYFFETNPLPLPGTCLLVHPKRAQWSTVCGGNGTVQCTPPENPITFLWACGEGVFDGWTASKSNQVRLIFMSLLFYYYYVIRGALPESAAERKLEEPWLLATERYYKASSCVVEYNKQTKCPLITNKERSW